VIQLRQGRWLLRILCHLRVGQSGARGWASVGSRRKVGSRRRRLPGDEWRLWGWWRLWGSRLGVGRALLPGRSRVSLGFRPRMTRRRPRAGQAAQGLSSLLCVAPRRSRLLCGGGIGRRGIGGSRCLRRGGREAASDGGRRRKHAERSMQSAGRRRGVVPRPRAHRPAVPKAARARRTPQGAIKSTSRRRSRKGSKMRSTSTSRTVVVGGCATDFQVPTFDLRRSTSALRLPAWGPGLTGRWLRHRLSTFDLRPSTSNRWPTSPLGG
jgi:hypothetical protein